MIIHSDSIASILNWIIDNVIAQSEKLEDHEINSIIPTTLNENFTEERCRICYDTKLTPIIYPCECKGTMGAIHLPCLERWLEESNRNNCELCGYRFDVERTPRYPVLRSIVIWLRMKHNQHEFFARSLVVDITRCLIVTPLTIGSSYICIVAADFYSTNNYDNFPPARWTTYSLLAVMILIILSYFIWMYMTIQYHQKVWFYWWQKTSIVRLRRHHTLTEDVSKNPTTYRTKMSHGISPV